MRKTIWTLKRNLSLLFHAVRDVFLRKRPENKILENSKQNKIAQIIGGAPSINLVRESNYQRNDVFILNHFWLHPFYSKIESGYHCISDKLFLKHPRINELPKLHNENVIFITTREIMSALKKLVPDAQFIIVNYSGSKPVYFERNPLTSDPCLTLQTGATVAADFAMPFVYYMGYKRLNIMGFDLDYGAKQDRYAYDVKGAIYTNRMYLADIWPRYAKKSLQRWIDKFIQSNVQVVSFTQTPLRVDQPKC